MRLLAFLFLLARLARGEPSDSLLPASPALSTLAFHVGIGPTLPDLCAGLTGGTRAVRFDLEMAHGSEWLYVGYSQERSSAALMIGLPLAGATAVWAGPGWAKGIRHGKPTGESDIGFFGAGTVPLYTKERFSEAVLALRATCAWTVRGDDGAASFGVRLGMDLNTSGKRTWMGMAEIGFGRIGHGLLLPPAADSALESFMTRPIRTSSVVP